MKDFAEFIVGLFRELKLPARWAAIIGVLILLVLVVIGYENFTGHFFYTRLGRRIELLQELQNLDNAGIDKSPELSPIYHSLVTQLSHDGYNYGILPTFTSIITPRGPYIVGKAISGASFWLLAFVIGFVLTIKASGPPKGTVLVGLVGVLIIAGILAWIGALIPTIITPWVNYIGFPVVQVFVIYLFSKKTAKPLNHDIAG